MYAMIATISTHARPTVRQGHNRRDPQIVRGEPHIDPNGIHENWLDVDEETAFREVFGAAVERYNAKQAREDRKITSYYQQIKAKELEAEQYNRKVEEENQGKPANQRKPLKTNYRHTSYEMIIGIYGYQECAGVDGKPVLVRSPVDPAVAKEILREFYETWAERNPSLHLFGAYYHADEQGKDPHVHLDYIPVATGYAKGLDTQVACEKALNELGFHTGGKGKGKTAQIQWEARENEALQRMCERRGISVIHPQAGTGAHHDDTRTYQAKRDAAKAQDQLMVIQGKTGQAQAELEMIRSEAAKGVRDVDFYTGMAKAKKDECVDYMLSVDKLKQETEALKQEAAHYPANLRGHLATLDLARRAYEKATAEDDGGPLMQFAKRYKINHRQKDGSTVQRSVYDIYQTWRAKQEQQLREQEERARQNSIAIQRHLLSVLEEAEKKGTEKNRKSRDDSLTY